MIKKFSTLVFVIVLAFIANASLAQSQFRFKRFGKAEGMPHEYVWRTQQDSLGFIWVNFMFRLSRFDGHTFKNYLYDPSDSLSPKLDFLLGDVIKDAGANIWFTEHKPELGSNRQTLLKYNRRSDSFTRYQFDLRDLKKRNGSMASWTFEKDASSVWIGTFGGALYNYNFITGETSHYLNIGTDGKPHRPYDIASQRDLGGSLVLATGLGLWIFDKDTKKYSRPPCHPTDTAIFYSTPIWKILTKVHDNDTTTWLFTFTKKLVRINSRFEVLQVVNVPQGVAGPFDFDKDGVFWFGGGYNSNSGLFRFDTRDGSLITLTHDSSDPHSISSNFILDVMVDREDNVWVSTDRGLNFLGRKDIKFYNEGFDDVICANTVYSVKNKDYLILSKHYKGTNKNQLFISPINPDQPGSLNFSPFLEPVVGLEIPSVHRGKKHFWLSSLGSGVVGYPIDPNTGTIVPKAAVRLNHDPQNANTISTNFTGSVWEDPEENLWVLHISGDTDRVPVNTLYGKDDSVSRHGNELGGVFFYPENQESFWLLRWQTDTGLFVFDLPAKARLKENLRDRIPMKVAPRYLYKAKDGTLLIGSWNGLFTASLKNGKYTLDTSPAIKGVEVLAILEDDLGRWWTYGDASLTCYDRSDSTTTAFTGHDGADHLSAVYEGWFHKTSTGSFIAVSPDGISIFDPNSFKKSRKETTPVLTKLAINNIALTGRTAPDFSTESDIAVLKEITLDYLHNNFTLEFSGMEMTEPEKNLYRHKLEGYDPKWIETDFRNRTATYTNLPPGEYTFRLKACNRHGVWSETERTLKVSILPPPWRSSWAYTGYGFLVIGALFLARRIIVQRERLKSNLKLAKVEQEKEHFELEKAKEVDKVKSTFFANISHEFRTPLTLIKGPVQEMQEEFADHPKVKERMKLVQRNADLVLKLINQLLDLAKLESGTLSVEKTESDLNLFLSVVTNSFSSLAFQKNIQLSVELPSTRYQARFDKDKVETILINLINNAIKFTPPGGIVTVKTEVTTQDAFTKLQSAGSLSSGEGRGEALTLIVSDTGIGIPQDQQAKVFERFHQVSESHKEVGTGIGLSLVKELVALMKGTLLLKSEPGKGSEFKVILPVEVVTIDLEIGNVETQQPTTTYQLPLTDYGLLNNDNSKTDEGTSKPHILVVEDNGDLRKFIIDCLGNEFQFLEAGDGKRGLETAFEETPDLIISDVMMPEMDGITMTGKLKKDTRTSHIPLILLTAKTSDESKLSGLETGADDYLTKPFNKHELLLKVRNSIAARVKLREKIRLELLKESPQVQVQSEDEQFLWKVKEAILARLSDEQLSVESLAEEIGMSRSQLFRKVTALTGVAVNELIRTFRLQRAAQLLEQNWGPVTQVAYEVGFSNLSYFSKVFKEHYGVLPSEYAAKV